VTAVFRLSEAGRKASLLAGGNGRRRQQNVFQIPVTRMHLVHVDDGGTARLKLRPRFETRPDQRVVRLDEAPVYDAPPSIESLLQEAARNHELEAAYHAQGIAYRSTRQDVTRSWRSQVAESFLRDTSQRAVTHPSPTTRRCVISTERGRIEFDAKRDRGIARDVPHEALRRFHADIRARRERAEQAVVEFHSSYAEKQRLVREWIGENGTADQRARLDAGVLPLDEAVDAMTDEAFTVAICRDISTAVSLAETFRSFAIAKATVSCPCTSRLGTSLRPRLRNGQWCRKFRPPCLKRACTFVSASCRGQTSPRPPSFTL
jgi:hypothetical protein